MPKVSDEYRTAKRRDIAEAAQAVFERKGFHAASIADIIAESGMSAGAIYGAFKNKSEIVLDVAGALLTRRITAAESLVSLDPMPTPAAVVAAFLRGLLSDGGRPGVLVQLWGEAVVDDDIRAITVDIMNRIAGMYVRHLTAWHASRGSSVDAAAALARRQAPLLVGFSQGYLVQSALRDDFDGDDYLAGLDDFLAL